MKARVFDQDKNDIPFSSQSTKAHTYTNTNMQFWFVTLKHSVHSDGHQAFPCVPYTAEEVHSSAQQYTRVHSNRIGVVISKEWNKKQNQNNYIW